MIASFIKGAFSAKKGPSSIGAMLTLVACTLLSGMAYAAQTGTIVGRVTDQGTAAMPGVSIEASSNVLPQPRRVTTAENGRYKFALLPPGEYRVVFTASSGIQTVRNVVVRLDKASRINVTLSSVASELETVTVYGSSASANLASASLKSSMSNEMIDAIPVGQQYRDIVKLIPGVQYTEDSIRGPSAGGSGQDNAYQFDGVDITTPLFGTLSAEPSTHDIDQVSVVKGGASAIGFNRSGGFTINTISKSGTNEFKGEISYQIEPSGFSVKTKDGKDFDQDRTWVVANFGGPVIKDRLYFYGSYYAPTVQQDNSSTAYGKVSDFDSDRDEYFGKLTYSPTEDILLSISQRTSEREENNQGVGQFSSSSVSAGYKADLDIFIAEGDFLFGDNTSVNFKYTDFEDNSAGTPDTLFGFSPDLGDNLDITALDQQGQFNVPFPVAGETAYNAFIQPIINQYGYQLNGVAVGGGTVGGDNNLDKFVFSRESFEVSLDHTLYLGETTHDLHVGYKWSESGEVIARTSNGWGSINIIGGRQNSANGTPIFYEARIQQMSLGGAAGATIPEIESVFETQSIEINDTIEWRNFTFNVGVLLSNDELYGQGLKKKDGTPSGFEVALGHTYLMHEDSFSDMIQPRLGVTWDLSDATSVFANYSLYNPAASSLPRAASWARNLRKEIKVRFDANGNFIDIDAARGSSGKIFEDGLEPRQIEEFIVGLSHEFDNGFLAQVHARHRKGKNFWEDTSNKDRLLADAPADIGAKGLYVPNLDDIRFGVDVTPNDGIDNKVGGIGGSSYVIAQLDGAYTKYWEVSFEGEWNVDNWFFRGSYVWSHYYGNFDQDNTTTSNDGNVFIGSSNLADGAGRQLWNNKDGDLRGDRRHQFKLYGFYELPWNARVGAYMIAQSGQPWENWDYREYSALTGSTSDTIRYAEAAGSRRSSSHWQLDLNYTQNFEIWNEMNLVLRADVYNLLDRQTGYNIQPKVNSSDYSRPRDYFNPRRLQLAVKLQF